MITERQLPLYKCHKDVHALKIAQIKREVGCGDVVMVNGQRIVCGEAQRLHTAEAARGDVGMDHNFVPATFYAPGAIIAPADEGYASFPVDEEYIW